ncbi:MAG: EF-hand domain-containing protein [Phototrophicaceae bacterium]|jgi:hypothetical protein
MSYKNIGQVRQQKLTYLFHLLDVNDNGQLTETDFLTLVQALATMRGYPEHSGAYNSLKRSWMYVWQNIFKLSDLDLSDAVDLTEWLKFFDHAVGDEAYYSALVAPLEESMIALMDTDGRNLITRTDYQQLTTIWKVRAEDIDLVFSKLDENGDEALNDAEVGLAIRQFFTSDEPDTDGNYFFGDYTRA